MVHKVKGVVARTKGAPVTLETILVPEPGPGEALVRVSVCGVCASELHPWADGVPAVHSCGEYAADVHTGPRRSPPPGPPPPRVAVAGQGSQEVPTT